ncbi:unknown [Clostridium sp. CAG:58]|nr:unknown [Clostridium sp. CAG:58]
MEASSSSDGYSSTFQVVSGAFTTPWTSTLRIPFLSSRSPAKASSPAAASDMVAVIRVLWFFCGIPMAPVRPSGLCTAIRTARRAAADRIPVLFFTVLFTLSSYGSDLLPAEYPFPRGSSVPMAQERILLLQDSPPSAGRAGAAPPAAGRICDEIPYRRSAILHEVLFYLIGISYQIKNPVRIRFLAGSYFPVS